MGCNQSSSADKKAGRRPSVPMTKLEIGKRIDSIHETRTETFGGVSVRYAYLSQRGYYPDDAHKPNQDSYAIEHNFANRETDAFFGVFDGHGRDGDKCAHFVRDNLSKMLAKAITNAREQQNASSMELSKEKIHDIILKAHTQCGMRMNIDQSLDDSLSGTTSISVYLQGQRNRITINNVGDSRAVIGRVANSEAGKQEGASASAAMDSNKPSSALKAFALSKDQTPYRRDERIRIRKTGARILSLDQIEGLEPIDEDEAERDENYFRNGGGDGDGENGGEIVLGEEIDEGGDPPRVWSPHGDYPGTAFTRSIGDAIAEELGVVSEPELLTREITPEDKIIVLASDGVFEFLTNQSVIDICAKFTDPLEACRAVVAESYELWLQYELRTDDITMICIFVDDVDSTKCLQGSVISPDFDPKELEALASVESEEEKEDALVSCSQRPVRKNMTLEKSRALQKQKTQAKMNSIRDVTEDLEEDFDIESLYNEKTDEEKARIAEAIRASVVFQNITDSQRELIYKVMEPMEVKKGQWIIKQGTVGDRFYIVDEGSFEVRILAENQADEDGMGGNRVHVYEGSRGNHSHPSFGELALMYSAPRAASIIAKTDGHLWALHRHAFKKITAEQGARKDAEKVLKRIDVFKSFTSDELKDLSSYLCEAKYGRGDTIIKEGEAGDSLFMILPGGNCESVQTADDGTSTTSKLSGDDVFGEEILKGGSEKKYLSTVTATCKSTCWILQKSDVKLVMGSKRKVTTTMA
eukprot:CAMPEP_0172316432 /NCGR_PEP_ID=MMETSP1058-20130122/28156_1 /TAXON_ID=83371 /ORGANISM="Detonula confervacea, Strain CCMP 353" /LENGTH=755 /DNA_ID=CAMNT_0013030733 /DNA_START=57 /DNA_END=2324 /DNA_ORIENTATION=-